MYYSTGALQAPPSRGSLQSSSTRQPWNNTNRVVPNRVVSTGPVYPSKATVRAGLSLQSHSDYIFVFF